MLKKFIVVDKKHLCINLLVKNYNYVDIAGKEKQHNASNAAFWPKVARWNR